MIIVPNAAEYCWLLIVRNTFNGSGWKVKLFQNDFTPDADTVVGDFDEADFDGYAHVQCVFPDPAIVGGLAMTATAATFGKAAGSNPNTVYGWYIRDIFSSLLVACERFDTPIEMDDEGDEIILTVPLRLRQIP